MLSYKKTSFSIEDCTVLWLVQLHSSEAVKELKKVSLDSNVQDYPLLQFPLK